MRFHNITVFTLVSVFISDSINAALVSKKKKKVCIYRYIYTVCIYIYIYNIYIYACLQFSCKNAYKAAYI